MPWGPVAPVIPWGPVGPVTPKVLVSSVTDKLAFTVGLTANDTSKLLFISEKV